MLAKVSDLLRKAEGAKTWVVSPLIYNLDSLEACFRAAEKSGSVPIIIRASARTQDAEDVAHWACCFSKLYPHCQAALMLDEVTNSEDAGKACVLGYTGVALDDAYALNTTPGAALAREVGTICKAFGVSLQASLGDLQLLAPSDACELVRQFGGDIVRLILNDLSTDYDVERCSLLIRCLQKETEVFLALEDKPVIDLQSYAILKESGIRKLDVFERLSVAAAKNIEDLRNDQARWTRKGALMDQLLCMVRGYSETLEAILAGASAFRLG